MKYPQMLLAVLVIFSLFVAAYAAYNLYTARHQVKQPKAGPQAEITEPTPLVKGYAAGAFVPAPKQDNAISPAPPAFIGGKKQGPLPESSVPQEKEESFAQEKVLTELKTIAVTAGTTTQLALTK